MAKNPAGKRRDLSKGQPPYEVWTAPGGWTFLIVKKNQADDNKPYATWNVACITPHERDLVGHDTYVSEIKGNMRLVWRDPVYAIALAEQGNQTPATTDCDPFGFKQYLS